MTSIYGKFANSSLSSDCGGRIYFREAPQGAEYPHVVYSFIGPNPDKTFTEQYEELIVTFSLYSTSSSVVEITTMYGHLDSLFDECAMTITGYKLVRMYRQSSPGILNEEITTPEGTGSVSHWPVDYVMELSKS